MPIDVVPFRDEFLEEAAALAAANYREGWEIEPLLPETFRQPESMLPRLMDIAGRGSGVAALADGRLAGFLLSRIVTPRVERMAWVPDCGHGVSLSDGGATYREMYATISRQWVDEGCLAQSVSIQVHDRVAVEAWFSLGFGLTWVDTLRGLEPATGASNEVEIRTASEDDRAVLLPLQIEMERHLVSPPTSLVYPEDPETHARQSWAKEPVETTWLALRGTDAIGFLAGEPPGGGNPVMARAGERTAGIGGAFVREDARNRGVATALLNRALEWARSEDYEPFAVDFESANVAANRFWLGKGFRPVVHTVLRRIEKPLAG